MVYCSKDEDYRKAIAIQLKIKNVKPMILSINVIILLRKYK